MKIALVHNWPGVKNSELDLISRIQTVLNRLGHQSQVVTIFGSPLQGQLATHPETIPAGPETFDFALYLHYLAPKLIDTYSYNVNWNPLRYILFEPLTGEPATEEFLRFILKNFQSHDYILSASSSSVDRFFKTACSNTDWCPVFGGLTLHTTCHVYPDLPPVSLSNFKVFYIAANWERINKDNKQVRHESLLKKLDESGAFDFYGLREQHGVFVWDGIANYRGELPFDGGDSIVETCNRHGVALVLSSEPHRQSELVSTRIFQACAAGAVVISDDNPFVVRNFGDSVLTFRVDADPDKTFRNIMEKVEWIRSNPALAADKACASQRIFQENFSLDEEIRQIIESHGQNLKTDAERYSVLRDYVIDVFWFVFDVSDLAHIPYFSANLRRQKFVSTTGWILTAPDLAERAISKVREVAGEGQDMAIHVVPLQEFSNRGRGDLLLEVFEHHAEGNFFAFWSPEIKWYSGHFAALMKELYGSGNEAAQASVVVINGWFRKKLNDYYQVLPLSTSAVPRVRVEHLYMEDTQQLHPAFFLFSSKLVWKNWSQAQVVRLFDHGFLFALFALFFLPGNRLPSYVPKYTCEYRKADADDPELEGSAVPLAEQFHLRAEKRSLYSASIESALLRNYFEKSDGFWILDRPARSSAVVGDDGTRTIVVTAPPAASPDFSLNDYMTKLLVNRPALLRMWEGFFRIMEKLLKL